jgi:hypothetical protein
VWPFSRNKKSAAVPAIRCGDIDVTWNRDFNWWEFSVGDKHYSLTDNTVFNPSVLSDLDTVDEWLLKLDNKIDSEIKTHVDGWCEWRGQKELVSIDVSWLIKKREVDVSYAHDDWADLGVNIVITNGTITNSYAGD